MYDKPLILQLRCDATNQLINQCIDSGRLTNLKV